MITRLFLPVVVVIAVFGASALLDLTRILGAHPFWSAKVLWIGFMLGLVLAAAAWLAKLSYILRLSVCGTALLAAYLAAYVGKARFAASYGEDAVAGQMWYLGWIATCTFAAALIATALWPDRPARK